MEIRYLRPEEKAEFQRISAASFIWKFDPVTDSTVDADVIGAFDDGKLFAGIEKYNADLHYCGNKLNSIFFDSICTRPECRRLGGVRELFRTVADTALSDDLTLGFLHAFSIEYYKKFGFANLFQTYSIKVPFENLKNIPRRNDVTLYTGEQFSELCELYNKCAVKENLTTCRNDKKYFCATPIESADYTYIRRDKSGVPDGYVRFTVARPDSLIVKELFVLSPEALYALIGFLRNYDGIVKNLVVNKQYIGSAFAAMAEQLDGACFETSGVYAGRIYNLKKLLESNTYPTEYGRFSLLSIDDIGHNNGIFDVEYQNGKAVVTHRKDGDYDIALTAPAAAKLLLSGEGYDEGTAVYIDGVEIHGDASDFFKAFPHRPTRITEK